RLWIFEVRHVLRRLAIQRVGGHIQRVPRSGQLEAWILRGMRVVRNRHLVVEPPTQLALAAEKVVNQALNDLPKCSLTARYGILERVVPLRPTILLADRRRRLEQLSAGGERRRDLGSQFSRELGNRFFDINRSTVNAFGAEHFRKVLATVFAIP